MIRKGTKNDMEKIIKLYNKIIENSDEISCHPNWKIGVYPSLETCLKEIELENLYVYMIKDEIVGSMVINQCQQAEYKNANWITILDDSQVMVVHTLVVSPDYRKNGIGKALLTFAEKFCNDKNIDYIRLDTYSDNFPAIALYEKMNYVYCGLVDLNLENADKLFRAYEKKV